MTQEEKARAYDEALESIKELYSKGSRVVVSKEEFENIFPELKESEDEKIRKAIINTIEDCSPILSPEVQKRMIAWLEKQGESDETKAKMFLINKGYPIDANGVFPTYEEIYNIIRDGLEHQVEQKSIFDFNANNWYVSKVDGKIHNIYNSGVEPKFHKDEWVVNNATLNLCHILRVEHGQYICDDCSFPITKENEYHLWTIQDAKDGDVLDANGAPFIYKKHDKDCVYFYCGVNLAGEFVEANEFDTWNNNNKVYPATKEQRDLLFAKMKEAGYTFDSEKKELKKISQRMISAEAKETLYDKPAWSEEDEHRVEDTIYFLDTAKKHYASTVELDACIDWLKSIKQKLL